MEVVRARHPRWLRTWEQIKDNGWKDILLGNGASIAIHRRFRYRSLMKVAKRPSCPNRLKPVDISLFRHFGTTKFESILRILHQSKEVNKILRLSIAQHRARYKAIQRALIGAIGQVHPDFYELDDASLHAASKFLSKFKRVFTTNYDLLLYWIAMYAKDQFGDYFWRGVFNPNDTELWKNRSAVIYLHGALFLFSGENGSVKKIKARIARDLQVRIRNKLEAGTIPVIVTEGSSKRKLAEIRRRDYLDFGLTKLRRSDKNLVIFGHSLSPQDNHIVETINESPREIIAYAIHVRKKTAPRLEALREKIKSKFSSEKRVLFFDSDTFPIYRAALRKHPGTS